MHLSRHRASIFQLTAAAFDTQGRFQFLEIDTHRLIVVRLKCAYPTFVLARSALHHGRRQRWTTDDTVVVRIALQPLAELDAHRDEQKQSNEQIHLHRARERGSDDLQRRRISPYLSTHGLNVNRSFC